MCANDTLEVVPLLRALAHLIGETLARILGWSNRLLLSRLWRVVVGCRTLSL